MIYYVYICVLFTKCCVFDKSILQCVTQISSSPPGPKRNQPRSVGRIMPLEGNNLTPGRRKIWEDMGRWTCRVTLRMTITSIT